jgi:rhamnosyltransferase
MIKPYISIIIPTKNGEKYIDDVLSNIFNQIINIQFEIIVIDSGSTDNTTNICKKYDVKLYLIPSNQFGHGKTRNLGVRRSRGEFLVFLNQDAIPGNEYWLNYLLLSCMENNKIAGTYSRWLPRRDCILIEKRKIVEDFSKLKKIENMDFFRLDNKHFHFSTVSACIRKKVLTEIPFNDNSLFAEDHEWAANVVNNGYSIVYEPLSLIIHSHNYTINERFERTKLILNERKRKGQRISSLGQFIISPFINLLKDIFYLVINYNNLNIFIKNIFLSIIFNNMENFVILHRWIIRKSS